MRKFAGALIAAVATLASTNAVFAADLYGGSIKDDPAPVMTSSRPALFYARGDFTLSSNDFGSVTELPSYTANAVTIGRSHSWGGGIGYFFSPNVRGDLTLDWSSTASMNGNINNSLGASQFEFGVKRMVGLANLYYDFDTRSRFTPYLGVGLGFARNTTTAGDGSAVCNSSCGVPPATAVFSMDGASKTNAAGALMAGFSAKLYDRLSLDAGYRFLYTGNAHTSDMAVTYINGSTATVPGFNVNDLYSHEFRVGLRMDLR